MQKHESSSPSGVSWHEEMCSNDESGSLPNRRSHRRNLDTHALICFNTPTYVDENYMKMRTIVDFILQIDNSESCVEKIAKSDEYIFLIVTDRYAQKLLPRIHHLHQLNSVFITADSITTSERWIQDYPKIRGIYDNFKMLETDMQKSVNTFHECEQAMPKIFDPTKIGRTINVFRGDLWLIKLFYVLIRQQPPDDSKEYFSKMFGNYYKGNLKNEQLLKNFIETYVASKATWWYSKEIFIYDVLNKALREHNIEIICAFHFFIQDLYKSIEHAHHLFNENGSPMFTYRGQKMHQMDIDRIQEAHGSDGRLSINSFLSTTRDRRVAIAFIDGFKRDGNLRGVLFKIECNTNLTGRPFGDITKGSQFQDEQEVLFTPGTAFAVVSMESDESNHICTIKLRLCDDQEILKGTHKKHMFRGGHDTVRELFLNMESNSLLRDCSDLDQLYNHVTKLFPSDELIEAEYRQAIGSKKLDNEDFESSIENYRRCLALKQKILSSNHKDIANLHLGIAEAYFRLDDYNQTIDFSQKAINPNSLHPLYARKAHFYLGCSYVRRAMNSDFDDASLAKHHFQTALDISLAEDAADNLTTDIYQALADINENCEDDLESAIDHLKNALKICEAHGWIDSCNQIKDDIEIIKRKIDTEQ